MTKKKSFLVLVMMAFAIGITSGALSNETTVSNSQVSTNVATNENVIVPNIFWGLGKLMNNHISDEAAALWDDVGAIATCIFSLGGGPAGIAVGL